MNKTFAVGNTIRFEYAGKERWVRIEKIQTGYMYLGLVGPVALLVTGWDFQANHPVGGYRSYLVQKMTEVQNVTR